jgi:signal transduction histidine kinase
VLKTRQPQLSRRIHARELAVQLDDPAHIQLIEQLGMASMMLVPMVAHERVLGAIALVRADPRHTFGDDDLTLATDLSQRAALAIDNARLYAEARQANQTKTELFAMISHDLRTPLNSIIGYGQLLQLGIPEQLPAAACERVGRMLASARHQLYLIDELLNYARLDAKHDEVRWQDVDLNEIVREAAMLIEPLAQERGLDLQLRLEGTARMCKTDPDKLRQVTLNLLANAVKYTERGTVTVELNGDSCDQVELRVRDTGIGIAAEHLPHVFEPFWQVDRTQRVHGGGTGLGLSVVKQTVERLGGHVSVQSEPGKGSTFTVRFQGKK